MKRDMNDLKELVMNLINTENAESVLQENSHIINRLYEQQEAGPVVQAPMIIHQSDKEMSTPLQDHVEVEESLSLVKKEMDFIRKALDRHDGKRKDAAKELGISERTLYRKIKEYNLE
jgi:transcriptional regulator with PAS, ATPase and Fis domain